MEMIMNVFAFSTQIWQHAITTAPVTRVSRVMVYCLYVICLANICPTAASSIKNTIISYCGAYSATASTSSVATATGSSTKSSTGTSTGSGATATTTGDGSSATTTASSATSTSTNFGTVITPGYSYGAIAGLLAFAGALL